MSASAPLPSTDTLALTLAGTVQHDDDTPPVGVLRPKPDQFSLLEAERKLLDQFAQEQFLLLRQAREQLLADKQALEQSLEARRQDLESLACQLAARVQ